MHGYGPGYGPRFDRGYSNLTEEQQSRRNELSKKFFDDTEKVRSDIWARSRELSEVLSSPNPDAEKARGLQKEINELRSKMAEARTDFELEARKIDPDGNFARGYGRGGYGRGGYGPGMRGNGPGMRGYGPGMRGYGPGRGGHGPGYCWN
jgi:hypothetical protein